MRRRPSQVAPQWTHERTVPARRQAEAFMDDSTSSEGQTYKFQTSILTSHPPQNGAVRACCRDDHAIAHRRYVLIISTRRGKSSSPLISHFLKNDAQDGNTSLAGGQPMCHGFSSSEPCPMTRSEVLEEPQSALASDGRLQFYPRRMAHPSDFFSSIFFF